MWAFSVEDDRASVDVTIPASAILAETFREALENPYQSHKLLGLCSSKDIARSAVFRLGGTSILTALACALKLGAHEEIKAGLWSLGPDFSRTSSLPLFLLSLSLSLSLSPASLIIIVLKYC